MGNQRTIYKRIFTSSSRIYSHNFQIMRSLHSCAMLAKQVHSRADSIKPIKPQFEASAQMYKTARCIRPVVGSRSVILICRRRRMHIVTIYTYISPKRGVAPIERNIYE